MIAFNNYNHIQVVRVGSRGVVSESDSPSVEQARAKLEDPRVRWRLREIAYKITGSWSDAEDLVGDASLDVLHSGASAWKKWAFFTYMTYLMRRLWWAQTRTARSKREVADEDVTRGKKGLSREPPADDELDRRRSVAVLRELLERTLAKIEHKNDLVRRCVELGLQGIEEPAEQAALLKRPVADVNEAHALIKYHSRRVREQWELAEEKRMKSLRDGFRPVKWEVES
jgi:DNA-directed RNA polymerase specialized sigma24 family protein